MNSGLISVIIPVFNTESYLSRCLDSVCNQTYDNLQIILINDGSTDSSIEICDAFKNNDDRVEVLSTENKGVSSARNLGIKQAKGEYLTFIDSDDYIEKNTFEIAMKSIDNCDALFYGYKEIFNNYNNKIVSPKKIGVVDSEEAMYQCMIPLGYYSSVCNKLFKTECVKKNEFAGDVSIGEDELWLVGSLKNMEKVMLINEPLYNYTQRDESAMHSELHINKKWKSALESKRRIIEKLKDNIELFELSKAKAYNDLNNLKWFAYTDGNKKELEEIVKKLEPYKDCFFRSPLYSYQKKTKYLILDLLMIFGAPKKWVEKIGDMTTYKAINYKK